MLYKVSEFYLLTESKTEQLSEQIAKPQKIDSGRPTNYNWEHKTRDFVMLDRLYYQKFLMLTDLFDFIDLIELLKAFANKKLDSNKEYKMNVHYSAQIVQKNGKVSLQLSIKGAKDSLFLDCFECIKLSAKFSKILAKCEPVWHEPAV